MPNTIFPQQPYCISWDTVSRTPTSIYAIPRPVYPSTVSKNSSHFSQRDQEKNADMHQTDSTPSSIIPTKSAHKPGPTQDLPICTAPPIKIPRAVHKFHVLDVTRNLPVIYYDVAETDVKYISYKDMKIDAKYFFRRTDRNWSGWYSTLTPSSSIPPCTGIYQFKNPRGEIVYIGKAGGMRGIRGRIYEHFTGRGNDNIRDQKHNLLVRWRLSAIPEWREADLLRTFKKCNASELPLYNERMELAPLKNEKRSVSGWTSYAIANCIFCGCSWIPSARGFRKREIQAWKSKHPKENL